MWLFSKNEISGGIKKAEPVDKTLTNFESSTFKKLRVDEEYYFGRASKKITEKFIQLRGECN